MNRLVPVSCLLALILLAGLTLRANSQLAQNPRDSSDITLTGNETGGDTLAGDHSSGLLRRIDSAEFTYEGNRRFTITGELPYETSHVRTLTAAIAGGIYVGGITAIHIYHIKKVWTEQSRFHILEDGDYALYADKLGHFFSAHFISYIGAETALGAGFNFDAATVIGSLFGLGVMTYIEVGDGFGAHWGFSPSDMASNVLGASYSVAQHYLPALQNFNPKYTWVPPHWINQPDRPDAVAFFDNYNGSTNWLSINVHSILPEGMRGYWPSWLNVAVGYAARDLGYPNRGVHYIVALDYDLVKALPDGGTFWNWLKQTMNAYKFPSPAIDFGPDSMVRFRLLYPFQLSAGSLRF